MRYRFAGLLAALALTAGAAHGLSSRRLVVVVGAPDDPRVREELARLAQARPAMAERDVVVEALTPETARRRGFSVAAGTTFEVLLVGKDGEVKLRRRTPIDPAEIAALIDTMPMRREEMKRS